MIVGICCRAPHSCAGNASDLLGEVPIGQELAPCVRLQELVSALTHAHVRGVLHADIKPQNMGFRERLRLFDFGIALQAAREVEQFHGTPGWAALEAPRLWRGCGEVSKRLWALILTP